MISRNAAKSVLIIVVTLAISFFSVDVLAYLALPKDFTTFAPEYRSSAKDTERLRLPRSKFTPQNYFEANTERGFDIVKNVAPRHFIFEDRETEIFSNDVGCFDRNNLAAVKAAGRYDYFAGDSFTWGYADYDDKFATVYEHLTKRMTLKCGVTHTGQLHQFSKFQDTVRAVGSYPKRVFVGYFENDPLNDLAHPHSTVVNGYKVDSVELNANDKLVQRSADKMRNEVKRFSDNKKPNSNATSSKIRFSDIRDRARRFIEKYSLTFNLLEFAQKTAVEKFASRKKSRFFMRLTGVGVDKSYSTNELTRRNREAIENWANDARSHGYDLIFILIPSQEKYVDADRYVGVKEFLKRHSVEFIDLAESFRDSNLDALELYWRYNGHLNNRGNRFVGELLAQKFK